MSAKTASASNTSASKPPKGGSLSSIVETAYSNNSTLKEIQDLNVIDLMMIGALSARMSLKEVLKTWDLFKTQFVDWNEFRISSAAELADTFPKADDPLKLAIQLKEMLTSIFHIRHQVSLEFLRENTLVETREFFKRSPDVPDLSKLIILAVVKEQSVVPLENWAQGGLVRSGLLSGTKTSPQRQKDLFEELGDIPLVHAVLALHDEARNYPDPAIEIARKKKAEAEKKAAKKAAEAARKEAARIAAEEKKAIEAEKKRVAAEKKKIEAEKKKAAAVKKAAALAKKKVADAARKKVAAEKKKIAAAKKKEAAAKKKVAKKE
ncbi:MAG TPA: hypothetical protein DGU45_06235, partial [Planctomycetes bacterium]|nr:hypothetical protein [Planctomycetota bacterium]